MSIMKMRWRNTPPQISVGNEHIIRPTNRFGMDTISHDPDSLHGSGLHLENPAIFYWDMEHHILSRFEVEFAALPDDTLDVLVFARGRNQRTLLFDFHKPRPLTK